MAGNAAELVTCNEMQCGDPSHDRVVALRLQGKRWSEISTALGVIESTLWRWRQECPQIDARIATESAEYLEATKHHLLKLLPEAAKALEEVLQNGTYQERLSAAKTAIELFRKDGVKESDMQPAAIVARIRGAARLPDDALDGALAQRRPQRR